MLLSDLLEQWSTRPPLTALTETVRQPLGNRLQMAPVIGAARPLVVAHLARTLQRPLLVVTARLDQAIRFCDDLCQWLDEQPAPLMFPAADAMPYEHMSQGTEVIGSRLRVLQTLRALPSQADAAPPIVVAPVKALLQPVLAPATFDAAARTVTTGQEVDPQALLRHWIDLGYASVAAVEAPGEVAGRGGIIDIFPHTETAPLRIEFWGDEVTSIRRFDPLTQRSAGRVRSVLVSPPHEVPFWQCDGALARLHTLDLSSLRPEVRSEWHAHVERLAEGERFEGRAFYAPFFFGDVLPSLAAYLPPETPVLLSEAREVEQVAAELHVQAQQSFAAQLHAQEIVPDMPRPYLLWEEFRDRARQPVVDLSSQPGDRPMSGASGTTLSLELQNPNAGALWARAPEIQNGQVPSANGTTLSLEPTLFMPPERFGGQLSRAFEDIARRVEDGMLVVIVSPQAGRMRELADEHELPLVDPDEPDATGVVIIGGTLSSGWASPDLNLTLYTDNELFGFQPRRPVVTRRQRRQREIDRQTFLQALKPGDYVVHVEHGIAFYEGLQRIEVEGVQREYLHLRYAAGDALYVPIDQIDRVSKYIGSADSRPALSRLGTADWERVKRRVKASVEELARELLELYAARHLARRPDYGPDTQWQRELEEAFPYVETDDQLQAIVDVKQDLQEPVPMDRLVCGDVGYGKTEVAVRAAFKVIQEGKQVAVLVPTTVLAQQHFDTFKKRMAAFPVAIEMLSRFRTPRQQKAIVDRLRSGAIDIVIGTHRLLSKDVEFQNLGLLIVDEEQRFGVRHKERLKQLRAEIDSLLLSATPIPRTLHMAMSGLRDLSVIDTPPEDRVPIKTYVVPYEEHLVREAILREIGRGGQVYVVHNRVQSIYSFAARLQDLVPEARFLIGHGQLEERELERVMLQFFEGEADVLVCTTIIESGLDVPRANTIVIDDATNYGLAQLYQLRGRVGRSSQRAYAYLLYHPGKRMSGDAQQRLEAIQEATELGAGFRIAMRDLEIRGVGNLLGPEQAGHIGAVGFDLYTRLLAQAVEERRAGSRQDVKTTRRQQTARSLQQTEQLRRAAAVGVPVARGNGDIITPIQLVTLDLPLTAYLPDEYVPDDTLRLRVYQKLAQATTVEDIQQLRAELHDRFGPLPGPAEHLLLWLRLKALALQAGVPSIATGEDEITVRLPSDGVVDRAALSRRFAASEVRVGPQFVRINRRSVGEHWPEVLQAVLQGILERPAGTRF